MTQLQKFQQEGRDQVENWIRAGALPKTGVRLRSSQVRVYPPHEGRSRGIRMPRGERLVVPSGAVVAFDGGVLATGPVTVACEGDDYRVTWPPHYGWSQI